ncbi:MAG TPA: energy transducer TonB [Terriglobales bacterium]|nr:energy transducer TonB [Terriglobales bacterium]
MTQGVITPSPSRRQSLADPPAFLIESEPRHAAFLQNINDLLWPQRLPSLHLSSRPGEFWPDVFVSSTLPWRKIPISAVLHVSALFLMLAVTHFWPQPTQVLSHSTFNSSDVISYSPSEYLPPLDTGAEHPKSAQRGDPAYAAQPIISVPREADNHTQTIVAPPEVKLTQETAMANVVAWKQLPPAVPIAATENIQSHRANSLSSLAVVAPAPEISQMAARRTAILEPSAVAPQPEMQMNHSHRLDAINIGHQQVVAPAPQLPFEERHTSLAIGRLDSVVAAPQPKVNLSTRVRGPSLPQAAPVAPAPNMQISTSTERSPGNIARTQVVAPAPNVSRWDGPSQKRVALAATPEVVPPAPSAQNLASKNNDRRLIALNLHPSVQVAPPQGNRRGTFAATPQGKKDSSGAPDEGISRTDNPQANSSPNSRINALPSGLHVGVPEITKRNAGTESNGSSGTASSNSAPPKSDEHPLVASVTPPRVSGRPAKEVPQEAASEADRKLFAGRRFYSMAMNFANLNSGGGSWILHFAELKDSPKGDLMAPEIEHQVDPAYPTDLMRHNVHGTVVLSAIVGRDGSVSDVQVVESVDDRLDEYARQALSKWHFRPATKNGNPVALTMIVRVPFRPARGLF